MSHYSEEQIRRALEAHGVDPSGILTTLKAIKPPRAPLKPSSDSTYTILTNTGLKGLTNALIGPTKEIKDQLNNLKATSGSVQYVSNVMTICGDVKKEYGPGWKFGDPVLGAVKEILEDKTYRVIDASGPDTSAPPEVNDFGNYERDGYVFYGVNFPEGKIFCVVGIQDERSEETQLASVVPLNRKAILQCEEKGWPVLTRKALGYVKSAKYRPILEELYNSRT